MHHVSAYVEVLTRSYKAPTVKQHLAAIRMLFDWLIIGQIPIRSKGLPRGVLSCSAFQPSRTIKSAFPQASARKRFNTGTRA
jgi:hypothetical protein